MLQAIVENSKISIAFHCIWVVKSKFPLINIQSLLLIDGCLVEKSIDIYKVKPS